MAMTEEVNRNTKTGRPFTNVPFLRSRRTAKPLEYYAASVRLKSGHHVRDGPPKDGHYVRDGPPKGGHYVRDAVTYVVSGFSRTSLSSGSAGVTRRR